MWPNLSKLLNNIFKNGSRLGFLKKSHKLIRPVLISAWYSICDTRRDIMLLICKSVSLFSHFSRSLRLHLRRVRRQYPRIVQHLNKRMGCPRYYSSVQPSSTWFPCSARSQLLWKSLAAINTKNRLKCVHRLANEQLTFSRLAAWSVLHSCNASNCKMQIIIDARAIIAETLGRIHSLSDEKCKFLGIKQMPKQLPTSFCGGVAANDKTPANTLNIRGWVADHPLPITGQRYNYFSLNCVANTST